MKKLFSTILVLSFLLSGNAYAKEILFSNDDFVIIKDRKWFTYGLDKIAKQYCSKKNKYFIRLSMNNRVSRKQADFVRYYCVNNRIDFISKIDKFTNSLPRQFYDINKDMALKKEFIFSSNEPSIVISKVSNTPIEFFPEYKKQEKRIVEEKKKEEAIMFTIKDKREQCEAIGFTPKTEKFADCVLRLVELDVKQQSQNQIAVAQNNGNDALVKQLKRQSDLQSSQALIDLGQQLMNPKRYNSNIYLPQTQRCFMQGFGTFATMRCR